jgi:hypothetical protein
LNSTDFVIFLNGSYGVGKSSTLDHVGDLMAEALMPFSLMDVDWFHRSWPPGDHDPANVIIEAANMAAVWQNYRSTGPRQLVVSGVISSPQDHARYEAAFELPVTVTPRSKVQVSSGIWTTTAPSPQDWSKLTWTRPPSKHQDACPAMWRQTC